MKIKGFNLLLIIIALLFNSISFAQYKSIKQKDIPVDIYTTFIRAFPEYEEVEYFILELDKLKVYLFDFYIADIGMKLFVNENNKIIRYQEEIDFKHLPRKVYETFLKDFPGGKILRADKINVQGHLAGYILTIEKDEKRFEVEFNKDGDKVELLSTRFKISSNE